MTSILFATDRQPVASAGLPDYGDEPLPQTPGSLVCATATVDAIDIGQPSSGTISTMSATNAGSFTEALLAPIVASASDVLIFRHGAANSFHDAITRAAYNQTWLAAAALAGGKSSFDLIAFTWTERQHNIANVIGDVIDYRHDQHSARRSAYHFGLFLQQLYALRATRQPPAEPALPQHGQLQAEQRRGATVFQRATAAAAAIRRDRPDCRRREGEHLQHPAGRAPVQPVAAGARDHRLLQPRRRRDVPQPHRNQNFRLIHDGAPNHPDTGFFSKTVYEFVDCTATNDCISTVLDAPDRTHQYYRQSPAVRADIAASLVPLQPTYDPKANAYRLFPPEFTA